MSGHLHPHLRHLRRLGDRSTPHFSTCGLVYLRVCVCAGAYVWVASVGACGCKCIILFLYLCHARVDRFIGCVYFSYSLHIISFIISPS